MRKGLLQRGVSEIARPQCLVIGLALAHIPCRLFLRLPGKSHYADA